MRREIVKGLFIFLAGLISGFGFYSLEEGRFGTLFSCSIMLLLVVITAIVSLNVMEQNRQEKLDKLTIQKEFIEWYKEHKDEN